MFQLLTERVRHFAGCRACRSRLLAGSPSPLEGSQLRSTMQPSLIPAGAPYAPTGGRPLAAELQAG